jgi:SLT domain-containing protein
VRHDIAHIWDLIFSNTIGSVIRIGHNVATQFNSIRHSIAVIYDGVRHDIAHVWDVIWNNTVGRVQRGISDVLSFFRGLPGRVVSAIGNLSSTLAGKGGDLIRGLLSGITGALRNIAGWVNSNIVQPIIGAVKRFFGISSPSTVFAGIGGHLVGGLIKGLITSGKGLASIIPKVFGSMPRALLQLLEKGIGGITSLPGKAVSALKGLGGHALDVLSGIGNLATGIWDKLFGGGGGGSGVQRWRPLVLHALAMEHLPASYAGLVLDQMQSESGGNPRAQNNTDINAQRGDPSRGLLQTIGSTFAAYHWPGTSNDIFNPLANIAAAINYSAHGRGFGRGPGQMGSMHGYGAGGIGGGWATVGEYGRELVRLPHGSHVYPHSQAAMAGAAAPAKLQIEWIGGNASDEFITWLRKNIRIRGGDVQSVLGWG